MDCNEMLLKAVEAYHKEYGENAPLPDGGKFAVICEDTVLLVSCFAGDIEVEIIEKVYKVD